MWCGFRVTDIDATLAAEPTVVPPAPFVLDSLGHRQRMRERLKPWR